MVHSKESILYAFKNIVVLTVAGVFLSFILPFYSAATNDDLFVEKAYATTGWTQDGSNWYYYLSNGQPATGWQHIYHSNQWDYYYFESGRMKTGWFTWDGSWFYCADSFGQGIGFFDVDYGTCRTGWQEIYHSIGYWDWYYFRGAGSGRMETGWLDYSGDWYYLSNESTGSSFYGADYGVMLVDLQTIGAYQYCFRGNHNYGVYFPYGAMLHDITYVAIFSDGALLGYGMVDSNGHVSFITVLSNPDEPMAEGTAGTLDNEAERTLMVVPKPVL